MLIAQGIRKAFRGQDILRGVDVTIKPGTITVMIGPSGGGKSTLLRALSLLDPPTEGRISIDGKAYEFSAGHVDGIIAPPWPAVTVVFQQLFLWPHLSLRENIYLVLREHKRSEDWGELPDLIHAFEMEEFIDRYPNEVSIGQRQRAAFLRAVALEPKYILLDEITSSLDVEHVARVLECLQQLKGRGVGIFVITHLIRFARRAADQVLFFDGGTILESGPPSVLENPAHERVARFLSTVESAT